MRIVRLPVLDILCALLAGCSSSGGPSDGSTEYGDTTAPDVRQDSLGDGEDTDALSLMVCPEGSTATVDSCVLPCPDGWERESEGACLPPGPEGWTSHDAVCAPPCPQSMEAVEALCRPPEASVRPLPCTEGMEFDATGAGPEDIVLYVHAEKGGPEGQGTADSPLATLKQAFDAVEGTPTGLSIVLGPGSYDTFQAPMLKDQAHETMLADSEPPEPITRVMP